uniref:NADH dehydrogenase subunit 6 n=1 Tax=Septifer bilocularis TaxID=102393 RepID=A0A516EZL7_9BIVA|nr:NADH dehydrogenase subunit 6 [Septifer bilocularis]QDO71948.1 NADH dehydrogenase subunit 6 [Septifer bilocularis]
MLMFFCSFFISVVCCACVCSVQPLVLGFFLIINSLLVSVVVGAVTSSLLGFLFFMTYVGGVMVLFLYVLSIYPNEIHKMLMSWQMFGLLIFIFLFFVSFFSLCINMMSYSVEKEMVFHYMSVAESWDLFVFLAVVLLFCMMIVSYVCMKKRVPFRSIM